VGEGAGIGDCCGYNSCFHFRLGKRVPKAPGGDVAPEPPTQVEQLELELGQETVACSAQVVGKSSHLFYLSSEWFRLLSAQAPRTRILLPILLISAAGVGGGEVD
jgi:hypothetical protein